MQGRKILLLIGVLLAVASSVLVATKFSIAQSTDPVLESWFTSQVTYTQKQQSSSPLPDQTKTCKETTLQVARGLSTSYERHCLTPTAMGLTSNIYYNQGIIQPNGYSKAFPVNYIVGGNPSVIPVPNQASGLFLAGNSSGGLTMGITNQIAVKFKFNVSASGAYYSLNSSFAYDELFRFSNGQLMSFTGAYAFSPNGRYLVAEVVNFGIIRINLMNLSYQPLSDNVPINNNNGMAITDDGRLVAVAYGRADSIGAELKIIDAGSCTTVMPLSYQKPAYNCREKKIIQPLKEAQSNLFAAGNLKFANSRTLILDTTFKQAGVVSYSRYAVVPDGQALRIKDYLALGDSYISGEGAYSYRQGTDTDRNKCHQSLVSYPYLMAELFSSSMSVACSGARSHNLQFSGEKVEQLYGGTPSENEINNARINFFPGVIEQTAFLNEANPEAVTLSIGGNDIGFADIIERCVSPVSNIGGNIGSAHTCYDTYEDRAEVVQLINGRFPKLRSLYESILNAPDGGRRLYVIGYPQVAKVGGDCGVNVQLNAEEVRFSRDLISYLNSVIRRAAAEAGAQYVDTEQAFAGHRLCEAAPGQAAVNGFTIDKDSQGEINVTASYHPNQLGHQMLARTIASQTNNLTKPMPVAAPQTIEIAFDPNATVLQNMPKTNRALRYVYIADNIAQNVIERSQPLNIFLDTKNFFVRPNSVVNFVINSQPVTVGSYQTDATGNISINAVIPAGVPVGFHTLHLYGTDVFGTAVDIQQAVYVTASADDKDGDGLLDGQDSCILAAQSGLDNDRDGIDDACDPVIAHPPQPLPEEQAIVWWDNAILPITIQATTGP